ncbi:MAG: NADH-quinone oxidoreductase subunit J [Dissulfurispiraceae bacterium]
MSQVVFGYYAAAIVFLSVIVVTRKNPVHSVLFMLILFLHIAGVYILLNAEFLAAVQVIVYAGAILVLFVFAIMVLNLKEEQTVEIYVGSWAIAVAAAMALFVILFFGLKTVDVPSGGTFTVEYLKNTTHTKALGKEIFVNYLLPFEIVSIILLVAIIGAIVLAKKKLKG